MRNQNFWYQITGLVRSVCDIWEMDNSHITNEELKMKSLIKHIEMEILYLVSLVVYNIYKMNRFNKSILFVKVGMTYEKLTILI